MSKVDLIIKNGQVCLSREILKTDIAIDQGKIVAIGSKEHLSASDKTIDATGMFVIPGLIDAHVHTRDPGYTWKEDFETATRCAAFAGVTTIVDMPNVKPVPVTVENFKRKKEVCKTKAVVDFNHWASPFRVEEILGIVNEGTVGFKIFMRKAAYPYDTEASNPDQGLIYQALRTIAKFDLPCIIHPYNQYLYELKLREFKRIGSKDLRLYFRMVYAPEVQVSIVPTLIYLAKKAGAKLGILHGNTPEIFSFIKNARDEGQIVYQELNPWFLWPLQKTSIAYGHLPIVGGLTDIPDDRADEAFAQAWRILLSDDFLKFGYVSSDHAPHLKEEFIEVYPEDAHLGWGDLLSFYPLLFFTEVNKGTISLQRVVKVCSENVAKLLGLYPRKGIIQIGSDADLVILDMKKEYIISKDISNSKCGWSIWDGMKVKGAPRYVVLRGEIIAEDGQVIGKPGYGEFIEPLTKPFSYF